MGFLYEESTHKLQQEMTAKKILEKFGLILENHVQQEVKPSTMYEFMIFKKCTWKKAIPWLKFHLSYNLKHVLFISQQTKLHSLRWLHFRNGTGVSVSGLCENKRTFTNDGVMFDNSLCQSEALQTDRTQRSLFLEWRFCISSAATTPIILRIQIFCEKQKSINHYQESKSILDWVHVVSIQAVQYANILKK